MKTIWKYNINIEGIQNISMPRGAEILTLHKQGSRQDDEVYIWCLVDTDEPLEMRHFMLITTGEEILCEVYNYIGTLWLMNGNYVVHLIEMLKGK